MRLLMHQSITLFLFLGIVLSIPVTANTATSAIEKTKQETEDLYQQQNSHENTDAINNEINQQLFLRNQWQLDNKEWQRYQVLMKGIRGSISPKNISPIEVLGIHARNDAERNKYARIWAKMMYEDATHVLVFQSAYNRVLEDLYGNMNIINTKALGLNRRVNTVKNLKKQDRLVVFIKQDACPRCETLLTELFSKTQLQELQIDLFFVDTHNNKNDDKKIRAWANQHIPKKQRLKLKAGKLTLNHDNGKLFQLTKDLLTDVPVIFKTNNQETVKIKL